MFGSADFVIAVDVHASVLALIGFVMGTATSKYEQFDSEEVQEIQHVIEEKGIAGAQDLMQEKRGQIEINIGVAGGAGVGKSSFINAIRGYVNIFHRFICMRFDMRNKSHYLIITFLLKPILYLILLYIIQL